MAAHRPSPWPFPLWLHLLWRTVPAKRGGLVVLAELEVVPYPRDAPRGLGVCPRVAPARPALPRLLRAVGRRRGGRQRRARTHRRHARGSETGGSRLGRRRGQEGGCVGQRRGRQRRRGGRAGEGGELVDGQADLRRERQAEDGCDQLVDVTRPLLLEGLAWPTVRVRVRMRPLTLSNHNRNPVANHHPHPNPHPNPNPNLGQAASGRPRP